MAVQVSYPGVYIDEFAPGAPIQGVGTSTAAFVGVAASGDLDEPRKITSWDQFKARFGEQPVPGHYLWYAVRGFFENGGRVCYVVRASNGDYDEATLDDRAGNPLLRVRARQPGDNSANPIQVEVAAVSLVPNSTVVFQPPGQLSALAAIGARQVALNAGEGVNFKPGDIVTIAATGERLQIVSVTGDSLRLASALMNGYAAADQVRLADTPAGARTLRIAPLAALPAGALVPGTILTITQGTRTDSQIVESVQTEPLGVGVVPSYRVTFRQGLEIPLDMASAATVQSEEFDFSVIQGGVPTLYPNLSIDPSHPRYLTRVITGATGLVQVEFMDPPPPDAPPDNLPDDTAAPVDLTGGAPEDLTTLADQHYIDALDTLREIDDVNLIAIPDGTAAGVQQAAIAHCEQMLDRFAVLDALPPAVDQELFGPGSIEEQRLGVDSTRGYAGLYYPWLEVRPGGSGPPILVPPSGHVCGIMARSDNFRGVHKAPANEIVNGALGVERTMSDIDQGQLNLQGINIIRIFQGGGRPLLWGARTTATDRNWQYVNIRRLFLYAEESIQEGIRWAVFEPNNRALWQKLRRTITDFLTRIWRDGGLFGAKAEEAFYVRIDEELNPFSEQALGRLHIEIGMRPSYPAEFIVVRIGIWDGGAQVSEA